MTTTNDITGDVIASKPGDNEAYAKGWDAIWGDSSDEDIENVDNTENVE